MQVRFQPIRNAYGTTVIDEVWIGHAAASGDPYDFDGGQVQLKFGGSAGISLLAGTDDEAWSDVADFTVDHTKPLLIAVNYSAGVIALSTGAGLGCTAYNKTDGTDAGATDKTGYATAANALYLIDKIRTADPPSSMRVGARLPGSLNWGIVVDAIAEKPSAPATGMLSADFADDALLSADITVLATATARLEAGFTDDAVLAALITIIREIDLAAAFTDDAALAATASITRIIRPPVQTVVVLTG